MKRVIKILALGATVILLSTACSTNYFNSGMVKYILEESFPVENIDKGHTWNLIRQGYVNVTANVDDVRRVVLLSANPYTSSEAEILAEADVVKGNTISLSYAVSVNQDSMYVAAITSSGGYQVVAITKNATSATFSRLNTANTGTFTAPRKQEVYYCFENGYPQEGDDWDYNDLVLRISKDVIDGYTIRISVTLVAVGISNTQIAAAMRLYGVAYGSVDSIAIEGGGDGFVTNKTLPRMLIRDEALLLKSNTNEAVINMFDDAHAAFNGEKNNIGTVNRPYYNTSHTDSVMNVTMPEVTVSYIVKFKYQGTANTLSFDNIDPFIVTNYNGTLWETHKRKYWNDDVINVIYNGNYQPYNYGFTWALEIPYSWYRYPLEGNPIGLYRGGAIQGAYKAAGHSYGEWCTSRSLATDWYLYPTEGLVY